jgi:threonyl-tRNA synthetase
MPRAAGLVQRCLAQGLRADIAGPGLGTLGARIRTARLVPYQAVIGAREAADDRVALRLRDGRRLDALPVAEVLTRIGALIDAHSTDLWDTDSHA